jgi:periplasmic glucans biosynthesis protein
MVSGKCRRSASVAALASCALAATLAVLPGGAAHALGFEDVARRAKALAEKTWEKPSARVPKELSALTYDQYRDIRYKPDRFLWRGAKLPFEVAFFHTGFYFDQPVRINEVDAEGVHPVRFNPEDFNYGANKLDPQKLRDAGFAGFRVHHAVNTPKYKDEVLVFLGASYIRAVGKNQRYGSSARGLSVDTAEASGEEFPRFTEFWIERPAPGAAELVIYALLDTRSAVGVYRFVLHPGVETGMLVKMRLYFRESVRKLGIAPMSSMYFFGENQRSANADYRPEVHDADGLSVQAGSGEWIWRPLVNPKRLLVTSFATTDPQGFGLMQRDRAFSSYQDLEGRYELRPSVWVTPKGKWGAGRVELVQIPTPDETNDNIVAYWVPANARAAKETLELEYRVAWQKDREARPPLAWVTQTRRGAGYVRAPDRGVALMVDFEGSVFKKLPADAAVEGAFSVDGNAQLIESIAFPNEATGGWRVSLRLRRLDEKKPVELRGVLKSGGETISETWSYVLPAE